MDRRTLLKSSGLLLGGLTFGNLATGVARASQDHQTASTAKILPTPTKDQPLLLNFNENSLGMSPKAQQAVVNALPQAFRYPDAAREQLIEKIAESHKLQSKNISLGNGSSESIQAVVQMAIYQAQKAGQKVQVIVPDPTFNYAELYAKALGVAVIKVPLNDKLAFDIEAMKKVANEFPGLSIVYLCNPNNPTATITPADQIDPWIKAASERTLFLLDEAYAEFVTDPRFQSGIELVLKQHKNVVVTRTFSKIYALAGLRIGYAVAHEEIIAQVEDFISLDNTNAAGAVAALASLDDKTFLTISKTSVETARKIVTNALDELGLEYLPSQANFIFHKVPGEVKTYQDRMKEYHVFVGREFPPAKGWNRLTLGTPEEMTTFVSILKEFRSKGWI
ncbi:pyridoxal phosphate-dependent aminotransferase [Limnobaculum parvum]|uniref:Histidinol-phosphate aminotransferase family protein n=1 Tax=Limnobaculum parvum TaxID=2172103 RepID=A0A2Y9U175_9GAMM|nr:histidinol-phosphate transaminase [Limnobaculum parvum]AWH89695.1 histidinol-phosphate aminotransferase family protein [Limnobaculum parvum]